MPGTGRYRGPLDIELILDAAEAEAPALMDTAWRILEAEAARLGASLDPADVLARRAEGVPEVHITAAADELLAHLAGTSTDPLADGSAFMTLARIGALAVMARAEIGESAQTEYA
jgi:hypothetical protein